MPLYRALLSAVERLPGRWKAQVLLTTFGLTRIRLLALVRPVVEEYDEHRCVVRIPLNWLTRNHLKSMYFGVLATGADLAGGLAGFEEMFRLGNQVTGVFQDVQAEFLRRAHGDVRFTCSELADVRGLVRRAMESGERERMPVHVTATVREHGEEVEVARFVLTLSVRRRR